MNKTSASISVRNVDEASLRAGMSQAWFWAIMFGAGEMSFGLFAAQLRVPNLVFGLLTGVPMLLGPLAQVYGANRADRTRKRKSLVLLSILVQVLCFAPLAVLPFCGDGPLIYGVLVLAVCVYSAGGQFGAPAWTSLISVLVPSSRRADYFARVSRSVSLVSLLSQIAVGGALYLAGRLAEESSLPRVTAWVFAAAFIVSGAARAISFVLVGRIREPPYEVHPDTVFTFWQFIRRAHESNFVRFVLFTACLNFGAQLAGPYFLPYWTKDLGYASWQWVALSAGGTLSSILTLLFWGRFGQRFGNKKTLKYTSIATGLIPFLWLISTDFYYLIAVNLFSGVAWAGFNLSCFNYILEAVSPPKRARCVAYFNIIVGAGIFAGALVGGWLEPLLPRKDITLTVSTAFVYLLALSGVARLAACAVFLPLFKELRQVQPLSLRKWFYRIESVRYPVGFLIEIFSNPEELSDEGEGSPPD